MLAGVPPLGRFVRSYCVNVVGLAVVEEAAWVRHPSHWFDGTRAQLSAGCRRLVEWGAVEEAASVLHLLHWRLELTC